MPANDVEATVVVTPAGDDSLLRRCVDALERQTQPRATFDVIVLADGRRPFDPGAARGRLCIFLRGDVVPAPELVGAHLAAVDDDGYGIGSVVHDLRGTPTRTERAAATAGDRWFDASRESRLDWSHAHPWNLSVPRRALLGSDVSTDASELAVRLEEQGLVARWVADARVTRVSRASLHRLLAERVLEGKAHGDALARHPALVPRHVGRFGEVSPLELTLRRAVATARIPLPALAALTELVPSDDLAQRWVAFVFGHAYWRQVRKCVPRSEWNRLTRGVAVLLYHAFDGDGDGDGEPSRFVVPLPVFRAQMRALSLLRYDVLSYDEFAAAFRAGRLPPRRSVVLTIDDGYRDNASIAGVLTRRGFRATIFVVSGRVGAVNDWSDAPPLHGRPLLSIPELAQLRTRGIDFGAHTVTHPALTELADDALDAELEPSRRDLEERLGTPIRTFAYPYGRHDERVVAAVGRAGFGSACTTSPRLARLGDDPLRIPRLEVKPSDSLWRFLLKVWFGWQ